ncbi:MAG: FAD-dependent oxidoreductase [Proteobacteria bacterium]|nr:FAD-dependent oxidoreductase [Pseudomonadota bacterium]
MTIIEKESQAGVHASGRNSGVLHAGFYYSADSLKAKLCRNGNYAWREYCKENKLTLNQCGKRVVARNQEELIGLDELYRRGQLNNVELEMISTDEAVEIEPNVFTHERALYSPTTATVNPIEVVQSIQKRVVGLGIQLLNNTAYMRKSGNDVITSNGIFTPGYIINTAGLYADKIARDYGFSQDYKILPFKGLYLYANDDGLKRAFTRR